MRRQAKAIVAISAMLLTLALGVTLAGAVAPVVTIDPGVTSVSYTSAHVSGTVDPQDQETFYFFQYSKDPVNEGWSNGPGAVQDPPVPNPVPAGSGPTAVADDLAGLTPGTEYEVRLVAENADGQTVSAEPSPTFTTDPVAPPSVSIDPVAIFTGTTAHFTGTIDPNAPEAAPTSPGVEAGFRVNWHFECTPACPGLQGGQIAADNDSHDVEVDASGLEPNTDYEVTLVASNAGGSASGGPESFETSQVAPEVRALYAGDLGVNEATLAASINPKNSPVTYQFEWGTDESYGNAAPATSQALGAEDNAFHVVTVPLSGLQPGTTYHFRVVATNTDTSEVIHGVDRSVTTQANAMPNVAGLPDGRVYEKVSPTQKNGADIDRASGSSAVSGRVAQVAMNGDTVVFGAKLNFGGDGAPSYSQYISTRGSQGWTTRGISPRAEPDPKFPSEVAKYRWFSDDLSSGVVVVPHTALNPGDPGDDRDLYRWSGLDDSFSRITVPSVPLAPGALTKSFLPVYDASADGSHIVFGSTVPLAPGPVYEGVYEWTNGQLRNVGISSGGNPVEHAAVGNGVSPTEGIHAGDNIISDDGSRIFFSTRNGVTGQQQTLAVRENGTSTREIASNLTGNSPPVFQAAKPSDGSVAFFTSYAPLTPDATGHGQFCGTFPGNVTGCPDLFRWDASASPGNDLTDLTSADPDGGGVLGVLGISDDATKVYFAATGDLAPGAIQGIPNLYLWQQDSGVQLVATLSAAVDQETYLDSGLWSDSLLSEAANGGRGTYGSHPRVTPDGRYILFPSHARITAYDNAGFKQLYLYDSIKDELVCASCNPRTLQSSADSHLSILTDDNPNHQANGVNRQRSINLATDGTVFFDTREALVPGDTNGKVDVYEWKNGSPHLISSGESGADSTFMGASADGANVFIVTSQSLVRSDRDVLLDVYDARVGGLAEPAPIPGCQGDECQGTPTAPPAFTDPGTSSLSGAGNPQPKLKKHRHKSRKKRRGKHKGRHQLAVSRSIGKAG